MTRVLSKNTPATPAIPKPKDQGTDPIELGVNDLIEKGRQRGYLTWEELNEALPDETVLPDRLEAILQKVDELGIDMVDEAEAQKLAFTEDSTPTGKQPFNPVEVVAAEEEFPTETPSRRIDDPVRMYLTQMGEIPLLSRAEEISLARKIELTRTAFRRKVLESDCSLAAAVETLQMVYDGSLPFDRTMKISSGENQAKNAVMARLPGNLATVRKLMELNQEDWTKLTSRGSAKSTSARTGGTSCSAAARP